MRSAAIIAGRLRRCSSSGTTGTATTAPTARPIAANAETWAGLACSTMIAIRGKASNATKEPAVLIA